MIFNFNDDLNKSTLIYENDLKKSSMNEKLGFESLQTLACKQGINFGVSWMKLECRYVLEHISQCLLL